MFTIFNAELTLVGIVLAVVINFIVGMVWFGPLFGNYWMSLINKKPEDLKASNVDYALAVVNGFVTAIAINMLASYAYNTSLITSREFLFSGPWMPVAAAIVAAVIAWAGFTVTSSHNYVLWESRSKRLFMFNMAHQFVAYVLMAVAIGLFMGA